MERKNYIWCDNDGEGHKFMCMKRERDAWNDFYQIPHARLGANEGEPQ